MMLLPRLATVKTIKILSYPPHRPPRTHLTDEEEAIWKMKMTPLVFYEFEYGWNKPHLLLEPLFSPALLLQLLTAVVVTRLLPAILVVGRIQQAIRIEIEPDVATENPRSRKSH
jgi:hypothetical protein